MKALQWPRLAGPQPILSCPLTTSLIPQKSAGSPTPTYSRASAAYVQDHEGVQRQVLTNEARFWGARRVFNYDQKSDFSSTWVNVSGKIHPDPFGGNTAVLHTTVGLTSYGMFTRSSLDAAYPTLHVGRKLLASCYVKAGTATHVGIRLGSIGNSTVPSDQYVTFNLSTGAKQDNGNSAASYDRAEAINIGNGWWRIWILGTATAALVCNDLALFNNAGGDTTSNAQPSVTGYYYGHQVEDVTGQSVQTPSEYVPALARAASASFPSYVDGAQCLDTVRLHTQNALIRTNEFDNTGIWGLPTNLVPTRSALTVPDTGEQAWQIADNSNNAQHQLAQQLSVNLNTVAGQIAVRGSFRVRAGTMDTAAFRISDNALNNELRFLVNSITARTFSATATGSCAFTSSSMTDLGSGWALCTFTGTFPATSTQPLFFLFQTSNSVLSYVGTGTTVFVGSPSVTVASPSVLSTYVPTTSAVAGPTDTGTTAPIPATTALGYLSEAAGTQLVTPTAAIRLVSDASWAKVGAPTIITATGIDGVANVCNRITATAGNTTLLQTLVAAATSRTFSVFIRRVTGTGNIELTQDGGGAWTNINGSLIAGQWVRVQLNASILNASFGVRIVTATDAIEMDFMQFEASASSPSSVLSTTGPSRNNDSLTYLPANNIVGTLGSAYGEMCAVVANAVGGGLLNVSSVEPIWLDSNGARGLTADGTSNLTTTGGSNSFTTVGQCNKVAATWGAGTRSVATKGATLGTGAFDGDINVGGFLQVGTNGASSLHPAGVTVRNIRIYSQKLTDAQLTAMVA